MADSQAHWLEISLTVDGELAEAVSEVLDRFVSNGVVIESSVEFYDEEDQGTPTGPVRVYGYLVVDPSLEEKRTRLEEALWHLGQIQPLPTPQYKDIHEENWMEAWKKNYKPVRIGKKLLILPAWMETIDPARIAVRIDPNMAFGTGTHPTTQLVMELLETYVIPDEGVIDIGCGSGILSIAAVLLGAGSAVAVDIDSLAITATLSNATANGVVERIETGIGSVQEVLEGNYSLKQAPVVLANILAPIIIRLFEGGLADLIEPQGVIILSGILAEQAERVDTAAKKAGLTYIETRQLNDWVGMVYR
ncbi:MAG TPA: 50S ribosomal protein L11 methyltransferase, partial [Longilinea sp.]|nr:50S ribosomal protein L11 methyltransferase [Longilinea sp.]